MAGRTMPQSPWARVRAGAIGDGAPGAIVGIVGGDGPNQAPGSPAEDQEAGPRQFVLRAVPMLAPLALFLRVTTWLSWEATLITGMAFREKMVSLGPARA